jgi:hypothetical protein
LAAKGRGCKFGGLNELIATDIAAEAAVDLENDRVVLVVRSAELERKLTEIKAGSGGGDPEIVGVRICSIDLGVCPGFRADAHQDVGMHAANQATQRKQQKTSVKSMEQGIWNGWIHRAVSEYWG